MFRFDRNSRNAAAEAATTHRTNLRRNLMRRMEAAREKGDLNLLQQLEQEAKYLG